MSLEFVELKVSSLGNVEFGQYIKDQINQLGLLPANTIKDATLIAALKEVNTHLAAYDKGLVKVTKNKDTDEVGVADKTRDISLTALGAAIFLGTLSNVEAELKAAANLNTLYKTYGGAAIIKLNYAKESNTIDNLIADIEGAKYSGDVALLGIGKYVARLKTDNNAFKTLFSTRLQGETGKVYTDNKASRDQLNSSYDTLTGYVLFNAKLKGGEFVTVLDALNVTRKYYANLLAIRKGKKEAKDDKNGGNDTPQTPTL